MARTLGILLAGGHGRRLGADRPKALAELGRRTLLARAQEALAAACDDVVVVAPASLALPVEAARRVHDAEPGEGPLAGLVAGLAARPCERALALAVDLPLASPAWLRALLAQLGDATAVVPAPGGVPQPLAAAYAAAAFAPLADARARGGRALVPEVRALAGVRWLDDAALAAMPGGAGALLNVNTPADLDAAARSLAHAELSR